MVEPESPSRIALVSDDDPLIRRVVAMALESVGWSVLEAADGATELAALEREEVGLTIADRNMPGPDLATRLANVARLRPRAAIVVLSGDGATSARDDIVYLAKPVELHELLDGVTRALGLAPRRIVG